jgi:hypothetical protein
MKKLILMLAIAGFIVSSYAQNLMVSEVPAVVTKAFNKTHKNIDTVQWSKVNDSYKACYDVKKKSMSYTYNTSGKLQLTEKEITLAELPTSVLSYVNDNYRGGPIKKSLKITTPSGKSSYMVKLKDLDLAFDSKGKFVN